MKSNFLFFITCAFVFAACSSTKHEKKVFVLSNGKFTVDQSQQNITLEPSNTHTEQELTFNSAEKVQITVKTPAGSNTFDVPDDGSYVLNLKVDTLTGGMVNYGSTGRPTSMSTEQYDHMIDSTQQLIEGKNASDAKKNYFIPPSTMKKISNSTSVTIVGPYRNIPGSVEADDKGNIPEVYKFFTNKQQRESLDDLRKRMNK